MEHTDKSPNSGAARFRSSKCVSYQLLLSTSPAADPVKCSRHGSTLGLTRVTGGRFALIGNYSGVLLSAYREPGARTAFKDIRTISSPL